jgi:5-methylcytosine-specific restriction endonuclease McrA
MKILIDENELAERGCREQIPLECEICGSVFYKPKNLVLRGIKGTRQVKVCGNKCRKVLISNSVKTHYKEPLEKTTKRRIVKVELVKLFGGKCVKCGYDKSVSALIFHHRNPFEKSFEISKLILKKRFNDLVSEAQKCDLLCSNCHNELHDAK